MPRRRLFPCLVATACLFSSGAAVGAERIRIVVGGADFRPFPMAAPALILTKDATPAATNAEVVRALTETLQLDIELARVLELVPPASYLSPADERWDAPVYANWVNVGASGLVRGAITVKGGTLEAKMRLYDVLAQRTLLERTYEVTAEAGASAMHQFVDAIIELLTGEPGIFSSRIVFTQRTDKGKAIFSCDVDGGNVVRHTDPEQLSLLPAWGDGGRSVLFTSYLKGNPDLYRINLGSSELEWLSKKRGLNTGASVSPDGTKIALTLSVDGNTEIYVMDNSGQNLRRLTDSWGQDVSATWSADGNRIAFVSSRSGQPHIYVMNADGSDQRRLTFQGTYNQEPSWSPRSDGSIAFTARDENLMYDIFTVNPDSGEIVRLTQDEGVRNESPSYSPDGQQIVFTSDRGAGKVKKLWVMDVDGRNQRRLPVPGDHETPRWGPRRSYVKP